jgi:tripartite-type tricarboxylate transporter receptor subunit TctC
MTAGKIHMLGLNRVISPAIFICVLTGFSFAQTPFYRGKNVTVIASSDAAGSGGMRARALVSVLKNHIPGNPTIVTEFMPGGGGKKAANYIYRSARPDGLTIGIMSSGFLPAALLKESGVLYDIDKTIYLGGQALYAPYVFLSRRGADVSTLEKLRAVTGIRIGAQSVGHISYTGGRIFASLLDLKEPKFVTGYPGGEDIDIALEQGELDARVNPADTILRRNPDGIEKIGRDFHAIIEVPKGRKHPHPAFNKLPDLTNFARSNPERNVIEMFRAFRLVGMILVFPPGTPKDNVQILQEAMRRTFKDASFYTEYKKASGEEATPLMPEELEKAVQDLPRDQPAMDLFKKLAGPDPLPTR